MKFNRNLNGRQLTRNWPAPTHNDLGTMRQHLNAIDLFLSDPTRIADRPAAWARSWRAMVTLPQKWSRATQ
jgi:hypothetical protein